MAFRTSDNVYNGIILTRQYCDYNNMAFVSRNTRYDAGGFAYRYCGSGDADFTARYVAYGGVLFLPSDICALSQALLCRVIRVISQVVLTPLL